jgi:ATP-dependent helicase/nuclease subunit A
VLIDEAQDTSPAQWEVIRALTAEFFAGAGARSSTKRSIFAVGDEKQSIYSFQGAAPHLFDEMRQRYQFEHEAGRIPFAPVPLHHSFRSTVDVLGAVDEVFKLPHAHAGLAHDPVATLHEAVRVGSPGSVELWPLIEPAAKTEVEPWDAPFDSVSEESPPVLLARRIARDIARRIEAREPVESRESAALRPGDILILVRQRGPLFEAVIRALKGAGVDVAGADRLVLTDHIAVMDLMALADALLLRDDDLALAEVLKSPLFGMSEEGLFALAYNRRGTLRHALDEKAKHDPTLDAIAQRLTVLEERSRADGPFVFYSRLLGADGGRRQIRARLGAEADDALDEFLSLTMEYERRNTPSLQGFVAWLRAANAEVKRDMDVVRDEVRVMTVHGAKGLEAPIVYLADTVTSPRGPREPSLVPSDEREERPILWLGRKAEDGPVSSAARLRAYAAAEKEHLRLLYVAMTRAADKLVVCGARGQNRIPETCWYALISEALKPTAITVRARDEEGTVWRWHKSPQELELSEPAKPEALPEVEAPPAWLSRPLAGVAPARERVSPSGAAPHGLRGGAPAPEAARLARQRGVLLHRLLQSLPDVPEARRREAAQKFLARQDTVSLADAEAIQREALAVLADPAFAALFAPGSRAEVPLVGRIERAEGPALDVSGQIDRLAVIADGVLIADFKTDRNPPSTAAQAPTGYVTQLALYRVLLKRLYSGRPVRAALVWTQAGRLMEIPEPVLDAAAMHLGVSVP